MLSRLEIFNFQSHRHTLIDFMDGVNIFTGTTDSGKTALIRAIRWVVYNRPTGDSFRSHWGGDTKVILTLDDGTTIARLKSNNENCYIINEGRDGAIKLKAMGVSVPQEISQLLNIGDINIQQQMDAPFLLSKSAGEVAKHFNEIANLGLIDDTMKAIQSQIRKLGSHIAHHLENQKTFERRYARYGEADKMESTLEVLEDMEKHSIQLSRKEAGLTDLLRDLVYVRGDIATVKKKLTIETDADEVLAMMTTRDDLADQIDGLNNVLDELDGIASEKAREPLLEEVAIIIDGMLERMNDYNDRTRKIQALTNLLNNITRTSKLIAKTERDILSKEELYHGAFPDECPLCGTKIN